MRLVKIAACSALLGLGCEKSPPAEDEAKQPDPARPAPTAPADRVGAAPSAGPAEPRAPGQIPFEFPTHTLAAKPGDYVLAPSREFIDHAFESGGDQQAFIYYGGWLLEAGELESTLKNLAGRSQQIPNPMIIAIRKGESASPGDIVLTSWASGSGMQRAIVVEGGEPNAPQVRYLDIDYDNASGWGKRDDKLKPDTFHVLNKPGEIGTTFACQDGQRRARYVLTDAQGDKLLGIGFAGRMKVHVKQECTALPLVPKLQNGDEVEVPVLTNFHSARVQRVDAKIGRVFVKYQIGGKDVEKAFAFTNVLPARRPAAAAPGAAPPAPAP